MIRIDNEDYGPERLEEIRPALRKIANRFSAADIAALIECLSRHMIGRSGAEYSALSAALAEAKLPGVEVGE